MLYNIIVGDKSMLLSRATWMVKESKGDKSSRPFTFLDQAITRQRLKLDQSINDLSIRLKQSEYSKETGNGVMIYELSHTHITVTNNNITLNPLVKPCNGEYDIFYIMLGDMYKMYGYQIDEKIVATFHDERKSYRGCALVVSRNKRNENYTILSTKVKEKDTNKRYFINVKWNSETQEIEFSKEEIISKRLIAVMNQMDERFKNAKTGLNFKLVPTGSALLTCNYLVIKSNVDMANVLTRNIKNRHIIVIDDELLLNEKKLINELVKEFAKTRVRTITTIGVDLTPKMIRELKLLYVFDYDLKENKLICKKSN